MITLTDVATGWEFCLINDSANHWRREKKQKRSADCPSSFHQVQRGDWILTQVWSFMFEVSVTEWHWSRSFSADRGLFTCRFPNLKPLYFWWDANMKCSDQHLVETIILRTLLWKLATPVLIKVQHQDLLLLFFYLQQERVLKLLTGQPDFSKPCMFFSILFLPFSDGSTYLLYQVICHSSAPVLAPGCPSPHQSKSNTSVSVFPLSSHYRQSLHSATWP